MKASSIAQSSASVLEVEASKVELPPNPVHRMAISDHPSVKRLASESSPLDQLNDRASRRTRVLDEILSRTRQSTFVEFT